MPTLGPLELVLIIVALVLVFGVGKIADIGGALGRGIREFRSEVNDAKRPDVLEDTERERKL